MAALISGPLALGWVALTRSAQPSAAPIAVGESGTAQVRDATLAAAAAQRLVLTWLTASDGDKPAVQALIAGQLPSTYNPPEKRPAAPAQLWSAGVDQLAQGRFRVIVATIGGAPGGQAYFSVPVRVANGAATALSLPGRTRAPASASPDSDVLSSTVPLARNDPAFQTAAGYIAAYLTGSAELDRWTAPGADLVAVHPAACTTARVDDVDAAPQPADVSPAAEPSGDAAATQVAVVATATCQITGRPPSTTQYGLVLRVRDGRWEVLTEDPALMLTPDTAPDPEPTSPPATDPASNPSTTTSR